MKTTTTPVSTTSPETTTTSTTADTTATAVVSKAAIFIGKTLAGIVAASAATVLTGKLLKTGASQKAYEEAVKEFTAK